VHDLLAVHLLESQQDGRDDFLRFVLLELVLALDLVVEQSSL
jgi:hypothetical protein